MTQSIYTLKSSSEWNTNLQKLLERTHEEPNSLNLIFLSLSLMILFHFLKYNPYFQG